MDNIKIAEEIDDDRLCKLRSFIIKLTNISHSKRLIYLQTIKPDEIDLISEIILNFLNDNIKVDIKSYTFLKRLKKILYILVRKSKSYILKRKLLSSLKGLQILKILLPLVSISLNIIK